MAAQLDIENGSQVDIQQLDDQIVIKALTKRKLLQKVAQISSKNRHAKFNTGPRLGGEAW